MAVLGYLAKLKRGLGIASLIQTVDDIMNFKIFLGSISKAMADKEKKRGGPKYKNFNISRMKRAFQMK